jgi:hypothetical protein
MAGHIAWEDLLLKLRELADHDAWNGVVSVLSNNAHTAHAELCFDGLRAAFQHASQDEMVCRRMVALFKDHAFPTRVPIDLVQKRFLIMQRPDVKEGNSLYEFDRWLAKLSSTWPDLALEAAHCLGDFLLTQSSPFYDHKSIGQLLTQLFREAEEREEADQGSMLRRVVSLQDRLLANGVHGLQDWLAAAERP